jgi:hypothetical protein
MDIFDQSNFKLGNNPTIALLKLTCGNQLDFSKLKNVFYMFSNLGKNHQDSTYGKVVLKE